MFSTINVIKGVKESFGAKTFMARTAIDVRPFSDQPGKPIDRWYDLGKNDWSYEEGTVSLCNHTSRHCIPISAVFGAAFIGMGVARQAAVLCSSNTSA